MFFFLSCSYIKLGNLEIMIILVIEMYRIYIRFNCYNFQFKSLIETGIYGGPDKSSFERHLKLLTSNILGWLCENFHIFRIFFWISAVKKFAKWINKKEVSKHFVKSPHIIKINNGPQSGES